MGGLGGGGGGWAARPAALFRVPKQGVAVAGSRLATDLLSLLPANATLPTL